MSTGEITAKELRGRERFLSTGCAKWDSSLKGGFSCRGITQIYGAAGTGKTQLALQLSLSVQTPIDAGGLNAGSVYICTEAVFPIKRLHELIRKSDIAVKHGLNGDNVFVEHVSTTEDLEACLMHRIPILMTAHKIGLIIIDSIAALYRVEDWEDETGNRANSLRTVGKQLHALSQENGICVICINQVTAVVDKDPIFGDNEEQPSLGSTWSSMITNSIHFYRKGILRFAAVDLSSYLHDVVIPFQITESGVTGLG